jgi:hypothetical protein
MREQAKHCALPQLVAGLAAVFIGVLLIDAVVNWAPVQDGAAGTAAGANGAPPCATCGVIQSVREVQMGTRAGGGIGPGAFDGSERGAQLIMLLGVMSGATTLGRPRIHSEPVKAYEITVVFENGSSRVLNDADPSVWKVGDRVRVVNGRILRNV